MTRIQTVATDQKRSYMQLLDDWSNENVIDPIWDLASDLARLPDDRAEERDQGADQAVLNDVRKAIRQKVLESYRNGQKAGPRKQK